jgi:hypothetical protein
VKRDIQYSYPLDLGCGECKTTGTKMRQKWGKKMSVPLFEVIWYGKPFVPLFGHA